MIHPLTHVTLQYLDCITPETIQPPSMEEIIGFGSQIIYLGV